MFRVARTLGFLVFSLALSAPSPAGSIQLGSSGWTASWDASADPYVGLVVDHVDPGNAVFIQKTINFNHAPSGGVVAPVAITFQQTVPGAVRHIVMAAEVIYNQTGASWGAFNMAILGGSTNTIADARFLPDPSGVGLPGGFEIDPFMTATFSQNNKVLTLKSGFVLSGDIWQPGVGIGELWIDGAPHGSLPGKSFTLKEWPVPSEAVIPLPAGVWTGLLTLAACGAFGAIGRGAIRA